ncbi:MAG: ComEC/Rec2 family competence protein, partial [Planctomycetota bacterium]|nr:ComEC/Rec2 family competence protein [Planctomycetota bacterium]
NPLNALALAAMIVLAWNPSNLFRVGSQLSFLAVATLIAIEPIYQKIRRRQRDPLQQLIDRSRFWPVRILRSVWKWFWQLTSAGLAIFLVALPLVMYHFHLFTPIGVILTPLLYFPLAFALASGLGILLTGWIAPPLAQLFAKVCDANLGVLEWAVSSASHLPGSYAYMAGPPLWWIVVFYAGLAFWMLLPRYRIEAPRAAALLSLWVVVAVISGKHPQQPNSLRCTFIDVGQGLSALLEFPDDSTILYDAGRLGSPSAAVRAISTTLWSRGRTHIDAVIISHADADHFNAVPELLERFSVGTIYLTPPMLRKEDDASRTLIAAISQKGVPIRPLTAGQTLRINETRCRVLHPTAAGIAETRHGSVDNANSLVLLIEHLGNHILLTGDLEGAGLERMLETEIPACDVLLAPHHGSRNSQPAEVVRWCRPTWSVISSGLVEPEPAVRRAYAEEGRHLLHTGRSGAIEATLQPAGVRIETQHGKNR